MPPVLSNGRRPGARAGAAMLAALGALGLGTRAGLGAFGSDAAPPSPRISSGPGRTTTARQATFGVDGAPAVRLECSLDSSAFHACSSPVTYRRLVVGRHGFEVRARSQAGAASDPASYDWTIVARRATSRPRQRLLPRPLLITTPLRPYVSPNATFSWRAPRGTHWPRGVVFACSLDRGNWKRCLRPKTYQLLHTGAHVFRVRARLGRRRSRWNSFHWTLALATPAMPRITSGPSDPTTSGDVTFTFEADGAAGYRCRLDGGAWQPCSSPVFFVGLQPAAHDFCVRGLTSEGIPGPEACDGWTQEPSSGGAPEPPPAPGPPSAGGFTIAGDLPGLLFPGGGGPLPLSITNPNDFDLLVSDLVVTPEPGSSRSGCDGAANLSVVQSNAAQGAASLVVPAHGSVTLPAQGVTAPVVTMLDLATNQDACKGAVFTLAYSGSGTKAS